MWAEVICATLGPAPLSCPLFLLVTAPSHEHGYDKALGKGGATRWKEPGSMSIWIEQIFIAAYMEHLPHSIKWERNQFL